MLNSQHLERNPEVSLNRSRMDLTAMFNELLEELMLGFMLQTDLCMPYGRKATGSPHKGFIYVILFIYPTQSSILEILLGTCRGGVAIADSKFCHL